MRNCIINRHTVGEKRLRLMKEIKMESKEFKRVLHNLHLENLSLTPAMQKEVLQLVNANMSITPTLIKDLLNNGKL